MKVTKDGREILGKTAKDRAEYRRRTVEMWSRQKGLCALCGVPIREDEATFDHEDGRGMGGSKRDDRIEMDGKRHNAAVCWPCNAEKGSRNVPYLHQ